MGYLILMFIVASIGIAILWIQQRREKAHLETVDGFRSSLSKIAPDQRGVRSRRPVTRKAAGRPEMDPARREAARRRVEARRRAALARASSRRAG